MQRLFLVAAVNGLKAYRLVWMIVLSQSTLSQPSLEANEIGILKVPVLFAVF